ncbi:GLIPR1-like protein 1 [Amphiura filiformis]|uniref:GLIPR1-like protein 1 n=1 Tax=Amphiura filiformis TaxID=82378 RepID=UPI003B20E412
MGRQNEVPDALGDGKDVKRQTAGTVVPLTQALKDAILDRHNELRGQVSPPAMDMQYMYWDDYATTQAEQWVARCVFQHGGKDSYYGQNLGYTTLRFSGPADAGLYLINSWYDEHNYFDFDANRCLFRPCGHYTQMVWSPTTHVGCGIAFCPEIYERSNGATLDRNAWYTACNYTPPGNTGGRPYYKGETCSWCEPETSWCFENKCRDCKKDGVTCDCPIKCKNCGTKNDKDCTCSCAKGWIGIFCDEECKDEEGYQYCYPAYAWNCPDHAFLRGHCPVLCDVCEPRTESDPPCVE